MDVVSWWNRRGLHPVISAVFAITLAVGSLPGQDCSSQVSAMRGGDDDGWLRRREAGWRSLDPGAG